MSEKELWDAYQRTRSRAARNELVVYYRPLLTSVAKSLASRLVAHLEFGELVAMGSVGLIEAVERFDPGAGFKFATFATWRVRGAILDGLRALDGASRTQRRRSRELNGIAETLSQLQGRTVNFDEAAQVIGSRGAVASAPAPRTVSWEELPGEVPAVFGSEERTDIQLLLMDGHTLNERERITVYLSFFGDYSLLEIGRLLGVTESRACQLRKAALAKLRKALERGEQRVFA